MLVITQLARQLVKDLTLGRASETLLVRAASEAWNPTSRDQQLLRSPHAARAADAGRGMLTSLITSAPTLLLLRVACPQERHLGANMLAERG